MNPEEMPFLAAILQLGMQKLWSLILRNNEKHKWDPDPEIHVMALKSIHLLGTRVKLVEALSCSFINTFLSDSTN